MVAIGSTSFFICHQFQQNFPLGVDQIYVMGPQNILKTGLGS
jgi:hypothetical protein